ncbi:MAG: hypothetical protein EPO27_10460 [Betaproteobacteria bacterium]|nr:MAG: hypothetical protein EPO27_10460 [Betaproteobacteria bacterium]
MTARTFTRPVRRRVEDTIRSGGKQRRVVVTVYPSGALGLRLERTRREEQILASTIYAIAVRLRVTAERAEKKKARAA